MGIDLNQFQQAFYEESLELLSDMERILVGFNISNPESEIINKLFRIVHTIKSNSSAFGFMPITDFSHSIETLMGRVRSNQYVLRQSDISFLLLATDCLRSMIVDLQNSREIDANLSVQLGEMLEKTLGKSSAKDKQETFSSIPQKKILGWEIYFTPSAKIIGSNFDPYHLFKMLEKLGEIEVIPDIASLPNLHELNPEKCYIKWKIRVKNPNISEQDINEVFAWIAQKFSLEIMPIYYEITPKENAKPIEAETVAEVTAALSSTATIPNTDELQQVKITKETVETEALSTIRVSVDKIDSLVNIVGELIITQSILERESENLKEGSEALLDTLNKLKQNCRELQEKVMRVRMVPISFAFTRFYRMVRDITINIGKQVELKVFGEQTEVDKTMMEKLSDPLTHLVRNSIDHGIESPEKRVAVGKPPIGTIELSASQKGGKIIICVIDDGAGINKEKILKKAIEQHLIDENAVLTDEQIYEFIFQPGFTTAEKVTEISGRGVGMDVVKKNIDALHGTISITSEPGKGSTIKLIFPLTLAIMDCQLVRLGLQTYVIPLISITEIIRIEKQNIHALEKNSDFYYLRGIYVPIINLSVQLGISEQKESIVDKFLIIVNLNEQFYGLVVDDLLSQQQVVIKNLEENCKKNIGISGATVLGDGSVALILDINGIINATNITSLGKLQVETNITANEPKLIPKLSNTIKENTQFLIFKLGEYEYGIDMKNVIEIRDLTKVTKIPGTSSYLQGVINLRGIIVPVMNLKIIFDLFESGEASSASSIIVLRSVYERRQINVSILVDAVSDTCYAKDCTVTETPDYDSFALKAFMQGVITMGNRMIAVLDVDSLVLIDFPHERIG
jgi:two-component system chemotaxis sensor kinase CheA